MTRHMLLPLLDIENVPVTGEQREYLEAWRSDAIAAAENGDVAASVCLQGALIELTLFGRLKSDWMGIMDAYLRGPQGEPVAYSTEYGLRLFRFEAQTIQSTVHAIHTRWWIENLVSPRQVDHSWYADYVRLKLANGLFYDHDVSETIGRHRMRSEIMQSNAQSIEILAAEAPIAQGPRMDVTCAIVGIPQTGYLSAEYFRSRALDTLEELAQMPVGVEDVIRGCAVGIGFCDFAIGSKIDAYMGTAKRTSRDVAVHSPLAGNQAAALLRLVRDKNVHMELEALVKAYAAHMASSPMAIPAFQMRDIGLPFGADLTPIEVICAAHLVEAI